VTTRALAAALFVLGIATPVSAKLVCPPGRFTIDTSGAGASLDGSELALGRGSATMGGTCAAISAGRYLPVMNRWTHVVARWKRCHGRTMSMRARFDLSNRDFYCSRIQGVIRTGAGRRIRFTAARIQECGNEIREPGEDCDGTDGTFYGMDCCTPDCRLKPDCPMLCDFTRFRCEGADEICALTCGGPGVCWKRADVECTKPVCDCAQTTTYPNRCAAFDAGAGVGYVGTCTP
jgi:hypothetical protein